MDAISRILAAGMLSACILLGCNMIYKGLVEPVHEEPVEDVIDFYKHEFKSIWT